MANIRLMLLIGVLAVITGKVWANSETIPDEYSLEYLKADMTIYPPGSALSRSHQYDEDYLLKISLTNTTDILLCLAYGGVGYDHVTYEMPERIYVYDIAGKRRVCSQCRCIQMHYLGLLADLKKVH